nr:carbohydrate sulfotransferase 12-like [Nerophis lumbriciformis]XP_061814962.1 carbohydrate sulfotransferase 12-like [Nerophis lumbriciformis]
MTCCKKLTTMVPRRYVVPLLALVTCIYVIFFYNHGDMSTGSMVQEQELRKRILRDACREDIEEFPKDKQSSDEHIKEVLRQLLVDDEHGVIYCFIPKVACTNLKRLFLALNHGKPYPDLMSISSEAAHNPEGLPHLASYSKDEREAKLKHYTKFMFVREPFVRLVSAFRDKFLTPNQVFYEEFGRLFLRRYGNQSDPPLNVEETYVSGIQPTFYNFVQYLLDPRTTETNPFEPHWRQMHRLCQPCFIEYDFIGHQETLQEDVLQLITSLNLQELLKFPSAYQNVTYLASLSEWFKAVPLEDRRRLYKLYEKDYKLFGYKIPYFLLNDIQ